MANSMTKGLPRVSASSKLKSALAARFIERMSPRAEDDDAVGRGFEDGAQLVDLTCRRASCSAAAGDAGSATGAARRRAGQAACRPAPARSRRPAPAPA